MCRRRFFKSYFYINYGGTAHGEAVTVSPFVAAGGSDTIELVSARPWAITNNLSWLSVSSLSNKSGTYTLTLTASENQDQNERSGAFTAKTLDDRHSIVVSVSQQPKTSNYFIYITPQQITLDAEASYDALQCSLYKDDWTFVDVVTPTWSVESEVITVDANGVVRSNNQTPEPVNGIEVSASYIYDGEELWDSMKVNVRAANIQRYITVSPKSSSVGPTGSTNLTVTYHEIINEQHTQTDVTHSNNTVYSVDNPVFTVNDGTVTANNTGETDETATISITYPQTSGTTATITSSTAVIIEWVELGPDEFSLNYNDRETLEVVYVKSVNGVETRTEITDSTLLDFDLSDIYAAKMNNMDLVNINVSNSDKPVDVYVVYNGISSNTIAATMLKPASLTYRLDVTADDNSVKYDGTTQMRAIYVTVINGADYYSEEINPSNVTWSDDSGYASVSSNGVFQANNDSSATTRTATVTGTYNGVSGTKVIAMDKKPGIDVYTPQDYNVSSAAGNCVYTVKWVNLKPGTVIELDSLNLDGYQPTSINITSNNYADDYEVIDATYLENQDPDERRLYLYATGVGLYDENVDDDDFYVQAGNTYTPVVTYLLEVLPDTSATLDYGETTGFTVMYYVITDGQPDGGTDVTTLATYTNTGNNSTAITVSDGDVENVNTGVSTEVVTFSVSYGQADDVDVEITANPAVRDKVLIVTPNPETIDSDGTSQMLAEYQEWIGEDMVVQTQLDPSVVTWSITNGNEYATIDASGEVHGTNETYKAQVVTVRGYYGEKDVEDTANITVRAASVEPYLLIENETEHTDARSDTAGGNLSYTIQFDGIEESSLAISGYDGNISVASINVNKDTLSVSLDANTALTQVSSDLYITATTVYGDTISAHLIITQPAYVPPICSLVWDVPYVCGSTKYVVVNAYTTGDYSQDDVVEVVGYIPENVSNISVSVLEASAGIVVGYSLSTQDEEVTFSISVNSGNSERHAIVRIEGDGADGNTYHDDLIIFQRYVEPNLLVNGSQVFSLTVDSAYTGGNYTLTWYYANPVSVDISSYNGFITSCTLGQKTVIGDDGTCAIMIEVAPNTGSSTYENVVVFSGTSVFDRTMIAELHIYQEHQYAPSCNLELTYSGSDPIAYNDDVVFNLSYDGDLDYDTIGYIGETGDAVINRVTVDSARKTVTVDLDNNCSTSDRTFSIILSALCGNNVMTASSVTITQEHSNGYTVTVNEQNGFYVQVTNNLSNDIRIAGYQVYTRDDCNTTLNVFQFIGQSVTIPANSSVNVSDLIAEGHVTRPNDIEMWASVSLGDVPNGTNVRFNVAGYNDYTQCSDNVAEGVFTLSHPTTITDNSFILVIG